MFTTLKEMVDPEHAALIVVDVQNDFCHPEGALAKMDMEVSLMGGMAPRLLAFIEEARKVKLPIIFIRNVQTKWTTSSAWLAKRRDRVSVCDEGSWGTEFYKVNPKEGDCVVIKHRYSAFIDTDLDLILRSKGIKTLIMSGVATNVCVESTARDGFMRDYYIVFLKDCTATTSLAEHEATLSNIDKHFGTVATSHEVIQAWRAL